MVLAVSLVFTGTRFRRRGASDGGVLVWGGERRQVTAGHGREEVEAWVEDAYRMVHEHVRRGGEGGGGMALLLRW